MENRVGEGVLPTEGDHVVPARAPLAFAADAGAVGAFDEAVAIEVAVPHGVDPLQNAGAVVFEPRAIGDVQEKIAEAAQGCGVGHQVFVGGVVRHAVLQQAAGGVAGGAGEPAFEGGAEERGGG